MGCVVLFVHVVCENHKLVVTAAPLKYTMLKYVKLNGEGQAVQVKDRRDQ